MALLALLAIGFAMVPPRLSIPYKILAKLPDVASTAEPANVTVAGWIGERVSVNEANRLKAVDLEPLLAGFRHKPGSHPWIGEHIGKWMHAATLAWANTGDPHLKAKLDYAATQLEKCQEPDGYLGTYEKGKRFRLYPGADWDVWSHKYCMIGLLTYYRFTGSKPALRSCERAADLLLATFGKGKKSILSAGTHMGMAATSVLEPMVVLYRFSGEKKYLDFAEYIVRAWDEPGGPRILSTLLSGKGVGQVANGKAYEMLSNLVGLCELARATGNHSYLRAAEHAWDDVVANQLYVTGTASYGEIFHRDHDLPNAEGNNVGETCVTVTWIQLSEQLLRLTGEAKYGDEIERSLYNHLAAAQRPDGKEWCYYTSLQGDKPFTAETCCCLSSGPRGMALVPEMAYLVSGDTIDVNLLETSRVKIAVGGLEVLIEQKSDFPSAGHTVLRVDSAGTFGLRVREPDWARPMKAEGATEEDGWLVIPSRLWKAGDEVEVHFNLGARTIEGRHSNDGEAALAFGPFVLAYDVESNKDLGTPVKYELAGPATGSVNVGFHVPVACGIEHRQAGFIPFAMAGSDGGRYRIWMRAAGRANPLADSMFLDAAESRSSDGNVSGSISDGDPETFVVTFDGKPQNAAWFEVSRPEPVEVSRIVFAHGRGFHDGGWFDCSAEKPRVEVRSSPESEWVLAGHLDEYPATTATDSKGLRSGQSFSLKLAKPVRACAIRVVGKPACGDAPGQSFGSCAELEGIR